MLVMTTELWPYGYEDRAKRLVTVAIANAGHSEWGGYDYAWTIDEPEPLYGDPVHACGVIYGYDRNASCVALMAEVLRNFENPSKEPMSQVDIDLIARLREKVKQN